ncbi:MAG: tetratricopeptide repeat protein [Candidatus Angelobacter sp.]
MRQHPYPECPGDNKVQEVAAGMTPHEVTAQILQHAGRCDHCGPLLNQYLQAFSDESSPEIESLIQQLPSSRPGWERKKAREIAQQVSKPRSRTQSQGIPRPWLVALRPRILAGAAALASLSIVMSVWGPGVVEAWQLKREEGLVSVAYAKHRVTEMRQTAAAHGVYQEGSGKMGPKDDADNLKQPELNKAWSNLSDKLNSGGKLDPRWLQIQGRLLLLKDPANGKAAETAFREAQAKGMKDPSLEIDLAVSYFEHDSRDLLPPGQRIPNLSKSIDLLTKVLTYPNLTQEQKAVALFNLAVAYEKSNMWDLAVKTWDRYLDTDRSGPWSDEARSRREADQKRLQDSQGQVVSSDPAFFLAHLSDPAVQENAEAYLEIAVISWLPDAVEQPVSASSRAYGALADLLKKNTLMAC